MKKISLAALAAASALALGGVAFAQTTGSTAVGAQARTSTPGAGCTATGNAMAGGNLGGDARNTNCGPNAPTAATTTTAPAAAATTPAPAAAATTTDTTSSTASTAPSTTTTDNSMASSSSSKTDTTASTSKKSTRVARADRG